MNLGDGVAYALATATGQPLLCKGDNFVHTDVPAVRAQWGTSNRRPDPCVAAGRGFLGLGVQPPTPEWGPMLGEGRQYIFRVLSLTSALKGQFAC